MIHVIQEYFERNAHTHFAVVVGSAILAHVLPSSTYPLNAFTFSLWYFLIVTRVWYVVTVNEAETAP